MKRFLVACLIIASATLASAFTYEEPGGVSEGGDVGFGNMTATSLSVGVGKTVLFPTLDEATGDEAAFTLEYTTNKATSGADTGILVNQTDTLSPGLSNLIDLKIGGASKFRVRNTGQVYFENNQRLDKDGWNSITNGNFSFNSSAISTPSIDTTLLNVADVTAIVSAAGSADIDILTVVPTYNFAGAQTGTVTDILVNATETNLQGATHYLADLQVGSISQFSVDNKGSSYIGGAVAFSGISTVTVDYAIGNFEDDPTYFIECNAALGNISTTLPPVADKKGRLLEIKLMSAANGCYLDGNGAETIDGAAGQAITTQYITIELIAGSLEWLIK